MRALLDTNVLISYLLLPVGPGAVNSVIEAALTSRFTPLVAEHTLTELAASIATKPYLARRIEPRDGEVLSVALREVAEVVPPVSDDLPAIVRDRKDDYPIASAVIGRADYIVTGDADLLTLGEIAGVEVVSPAAFARILATRG